MEEEKFLLFFSAESTPVNSHHLRRGAAPTLQPAAVLRLEENQMIWKTLLDGVMALGGIAAFGFVAFGAWLALRHATGFVGEGIGRFAHRHRRRARRTPRTSAQRIPAA
jgi:hypothetical protein